MRKRALLLIIPLLSASCEEALLLDSSEEMPLVVNCVLTRDGDWYEEHPEENRGYAPPVQYLDLYYAKRQSQTEYKVVDDAIVTVTGAGETYNFAWNGSRWECAFLPHMGRKYTLKIRTGDGREISSQMMFPPDCRLRRYRLIERASMNYWGNTFAGYYYLERHYDDSWGVCHYDNYRGECFMWIRALENGTPVAKICTNHSGVDDFNVRCDVWGDCAVIDYYAAQFKSYMESENARYASYNPEDYAGWVGYVPPIYVDPELWNRYSSAWLSSPLHDSFLRIHHPENYDSGMNRPWDYYVANDFGDEQPAQTRDLFALGADFDPSPKKRVETDDEGNVNEYELPWNEGDEYEVRFVSEAYDKYLRSLVDRNEVHGDELSLTYSPDPVYSNIEGALGCFGGQWITRIHISTGY